MAMFLLFTNILLLLPLCLMTTPVLVSTFGNRTRAIKNNNFNSVKTKPQNVYQQHPQSPSNSNRGRTHRGGGYGLAGANLRFSVDLYNALSALSPNENVAFSPMSISTGATCLLEGSRGETAKQLAHALYRRRPQDNVTLMDDPVISSKRIQESRRILDSVFAKRSARQALTYASRVFVQNDFRFLESYTNALRDGFRTDVEGVDFADTKSAEKTINMWAARATVGKIPTLINPNSLDDQTRMVLANAIYFKADWLTPFNKESTQLRSFRVGPGKYVQTPFMYVQSYFNYSEFPSMGFQMIDLPYAGDAGLSMLVVLPMSPDDLQNEYSGLGHGAISRSETSGSGSSASGPGNAAMTDDERLEAVAKQILKRPALITASERFLNNVSLMVFLPKFTLGESADLKRAFFDLGVKDLFKQGGADLSGITGDRELYVSNIFHKAVVEVDEKGTKAAAATAFVVKGRSMSIEPMFNADHPFLFFIRHRSSGSILFMGHVKRFKDASTGKSAMDV